MVSKIKCEFEKEIQSTKKVRAGKAGMEFEICLVRVGVFGREPWSSGYGRRLVFRKPWV